MSLENASYEQIMNIICLQAQEKCGYYIKGVKCQEIGGPIVFHCYNLAIVSYQADFALIAAKGGLF